jgi:Protein of unknown function (DUF3606)
MQTQANRRGYAIDVDKPWHVAWWAEKLEVSTQALMAAVSLVGNDSAAVEQWLRVHRQTSSISNPSGPTTPPTMQSVDGRPDA